MNGFEVLSDPTMLGPHHNRWPSVRHAGFFFPQREQQIFFPHNVPLQAELELLERLLRFRKIRPFELLKRLEQLIQPIMILPEELTDWSVFVHAASLHVKL